MMINCGLPRAGCFFRGLTMGLALFFTILPVRATTVIPPEFPELVNESDFIVRAVVKSVTPEIRVMPNGRELIFSLIELEVKQVVAGTPPSPLVLQMLGGRYGDRELSIADAPKFEAGMESIFFVQGNGRQICPLVRMGHGLYHVKREPGSGREYLLKADGRALQNTTEVSLPIHAAGGEIQPSAPISEAPLSLEDFVLKIRAAVTKAELREH